MIYVHHSRNSSGSHKGSIKPHGNSQHSCSNMPACKRAEQNCLKLSMIFVYIYEQERLNFTNLLELELEWRAEIWVCRDVAPSKVQLSLRDLHRLSLFHSCSNWPRLDSVQIAQQWKESMIPCVVTIVSCQHTNKRRNKNCSQIRPLPTQAHRSHISISPYFGSLALQFLFTYALDNKYHYISWKKPTQK